MVRMPLVPLREGPIFGLPFDGPYENCPLGEAGRSKPRCASQRRCFRFLCNHGITTRLSQASAGAGATLAPDCHVDPTFRGRVRRRPTRCRPSCGPRATRGRAPSVPRSRRPPRKITKVGQKRLTWTTLTESRPDPHTAVALLRLRCPFAFVVVRCVLATVMDQARVSPLSEPAV